MHRVVYTEPSQWSVTEARESEGEILVANQSAWLQGLKRLTLFEIMGGTPGRKMVTVLKTES
jgi:hypothetical protein